MMIIKKIFSLAASIISLFIIQILFLNHSSSEENNSKYYSSDEGILSLMYHRFNENKYPSTNIRMDIFLKQIQLIKDLNYEFIHPENFQNNFDISKKKKKID